MMNLQKLMKQAQQMQENLQRELGEMEVTGSVGGGMVEVKMNGHKKILSVSIDREVIDPDDPGMLEDLVLAALNQAADSVDEQLKEKVGGLAGGLGGLPGMSGLF